MPSGQNIWNQTLSTKRRRNKGDLNQLQRRLWAWLAVIDDGIDAAIASGEPELAIKWLHAGNQTATAYVRAAIDGDLEARLKSLESRLNEPLQ